MYIVEVTPFSRSVRSSSLSYFSSQDIPYGSIVSIPLRNKTVKGLVIKTSSVTDVKTEIKSSEFALKKIKGVSKHVLFSKEFITAATETAHYFATGTGSVMQALIPENIIDTIDKLEKTPPITSEQPVLDTEQVEHPKYILQTEDKDRYSEYKSVIREQFARNKSVLFCVPTIEDGQYASDQLSRGIEKHTFVLHSKVSARTIVEMWNTILTRDRPSLVIVTAGFVGIPLHNLGIIIVERENSNSYKTKKRPYFDFRYFFERYADALGTPCILGDLMLRAETLWRYDQHEFIEHAPIKFRSITDATQKIIKLKDIQEIPDPNVHIAETTRRAIADALEQNERVFILTNRKGVAPIIICGDCGTIVRCDQCSAPMVLHGKGVKEQGNHLRCHSCGCTRETDFTCAHCTSWKLNMIGAGTEKFAEELKQLFPSTSLFILDKDHADTPEKAKKIVQSFYESPAGILIGTEMALLYLHHQIENVIVGSIDSVFTLPDFRIKERILNILLRARALASQEFIIQTRNHEEPIFKNIIEGNLTDFYRHEFIDRKRYNYPPFSLIIKLSVSGKTSAYTEKQFADIAPLLSPHTLVTYPAFIETVRGQKILHGMIKIPREEWPNKDLIHRLQLLPPQFKVQIDAESIL